MKRNRSIAHLCVFVSYVCIKKEQQSKQKQNYYKSLRSFSLSSSSLARRNNFVRPAHFVARATSTATLCVCVFVFVCIVFLFAALCLRTHHTHVQNTQKKSHQKRDTRHTHTGAAVSNVCVGRRERETQPPISLSLTLPTIFFFIYAMAPIAWPFFSSFCSMYVRVCALVRVDGVQYTLNSLIFSPIGKKSTVDSANALV